MAQTEHKIDTKVFLAAAESLEPAISQLTVLFDQWQKTLAAMRGDWQGESSDEIRSTAAQLQRSSEALLKSLSQYPAVLKGMAGIYEKTEKDVQESGKTLKFGNTFQ